MSAALTGLSVYLPEYTCSAQRRDDGEIHSLACVHISGDGRQINISCPYPYKLFRISPVWPRDKQHNYYGPRDEYEYISYDINVSISRGAEGIQKDTVRRLLPVYHQKYHEQLRLAQENDAREDELLQLKRKVAELLNDPLREHQERNQEICFYRHEIYKIRFNGDSMELFLASLKNEDALRVIDFMVNNFPERMR